LTALKIELMDCAKVVVAKNNRSKENVIFFIVLILGVVSLVLIKAISNLIKNS
jgi:hypothetical protein